MSVPLTPPGKTLESLRSAARAGLYQASAFLAVGTFLLSAADPLLSASPAGQIGFLTGIILAVLLLVLGLIQAATTSLGFARAFPLSEAARTARQLFLLALAAVLPVAALAAAGYAVLVLPGTPLLLLPSMPLFWAPLEAVAAAGLVFAARELATERMVVLAATGAGLVLAPALSSAIWAFADPPSVLEGNLFPLQLLVMGLGFVAAALAFRMDGWVARAGPRPREP